jgi:hypothetical protein
LNPGEKLSIEVYTSGTNPGSLIRDAISGGRYTKFRIGSAHEDLFFKVKLATTDLKGDDGPLFFDTPEAYERHMNASVSTESKQKWAQKYAYARSRLFE